jgi:UDP-glucuronate 4-epimerase
MEIKILITGVAGFIGFHLARKLLDQGYSVTGLDNLNNYYDVNLKYNRLAELGIDKDNLCFDDVNISGKYLGFSFLKLDIEDKETLFNLFENQKFTHVVHLAAQAGVRHSIDNPYIYGTTNLIGFLNILEACRSFCIKHLLYASSSSVYGLNSSFPSLETDTTQHPASLYAATKMANELMAHSYSHLYKLPTTGLRFFTVYGPWGRPDMAFYIFTKAMIEGLPIKIFNGGNHIRDFTYIEDIVDGILKVLFVPSSNDANWLFNKQRPGSSSAPYKIYNIGNSNPVDLMSYIAALERCLGCEAVKEYIDIQAADVLITHSNTTSISKDFNYIPTTSIEEGIQKFAEWFLKYHNY